MSMKNTSVKQYFLQNYKWKAVFLVIILTISSALQVSTLGFLVPLIDYMQNNGNIQIETGYWYYLHKGLGVVGIDISMLSLLVMIMGILIVYQIFTFLKKLGMDLLYEKLVTSLQRDIMQVLLALKYTDVSTYSGSDLVTLINRHCNLVAHVVLISFRLISTGMMCLFHIAFMLFLSLKITLVGGAIMGVMLMITRFKLKALHRFGEEINKHYMSFSRRVEEYLFGIKYIKVMGIEKSCFKVLSTTLDKIYMTNKKRVQIKNSLELVITPIYFLAILSFLYIAFSILKMPFSSIMVYLLVGTRLVPFIQALLDDYSSFSSYVPSINDIEPLISSSRSQLVFPELKMTRVAEMELKEIDFSYDKTLILSKFNYTFKKGSRYAIIGPSGSGKSTLIDIILNLIHQDKGTITIDQDMSLSQNDQVDAFYLTQTPAVIEGTVKENLMFGKCHEGLKNVDFIAALENVNLWSDFEKREGLDTYIEHESKNISIGQKQRLALARLFLYDYSLIVLDECTSSVDEKSKTMIIDAIKKIQNAIIVMVTHDEAIMNACDECITIKNGDLVKV